MIHFQLSSVKYCIISENGASIYSCSRIADVELKDMPVEYRGAVSIARRLQDPLAELVKIDPQSIGVGMYQHDISKKILEEKCKEVVVDCVNEVGANLNSARFFLKNYLSIVLLY